MSACFVGERLLVSQSGEWLQGYAIITTDPNDLMESIHTRMPVILYPEDYDR